MKSSKIFLVSILLFCSICLYNNIKAQSFRTTVYNRDEGLHNELIKTLAIDSLNVIWMATDEGLISYNGLVFKQYKDQFLSNYIKSIFKSSLGSLFCASDLGIYKIDYSPDSVNFNLIKTGYSKTADTSLWYPKLFFEDNDKTIWFSDNNSIWKILDNDIKKYIMPKENLTMSWHRSFSFFEDGYGNFYAFSHPGNLFIYNKNTDNFDNVSLPQPAGYVSHCINFNKGQILVASSTGVYIYRFDKEGNLINTTQIQSQVDASYLEKKNETDIWVGTWAQGLFLIKNADTNPEIIKIENYEFKTINFLYQNANGDLWVAGDNGIVLIQISDCDALYQNQSNTYTQSIFQKSENELYFTDGNNVYKVNPQNVYNEATKIISNPQKTFLSFAKVNEQLWVSDASGIISIIEDDKIIKTIDLSKNGGSIFNMLTDADNNVWLCQDNVAGTVRIDKNLKIKNYTSEQGINSSAVILTLSPDNLLYAGCVNNGNFLFVYDKNSDKFKNLSKDFDTEQPRDIIIHQMCFQNTTLWIGTSYGLAKFENNEFSRVIFDDVISVDAVKALTVDNLGNVWFANSTGVVKIENGECYIFDETCGMPSKTISFRGLITDSNNQIWAGTVAGIGLFTNKTKAAKTSKPYFIYIQNDEVNIGLNQNVFLNNSLFKFKFVSSSYPSEYLQYRWRLIGKSDEWNELESLDGLFLSNLKSGDYCLEISCRQIGNYTWSDPLIFNFRTKTADYKTWLAVCIYLLILFVIIFLFVKLYTKRLIKQKEILEQIVKERTAQITEQKIEIQEKNEKLNQTNEELKTTLEMLNGTNEELKQTNEELLTTIEVVNSQKDEIEIAHKNIRGSINYARRIQTAVLPNEQIISQILNDYFILFKPRDIVSGDFYFIRQINNLTYIIVADCTGHGVPGAFMSMLGLTLINELVQKSTIKNAGLFLDELRKLVKKSLQQTGQPGEQQDGMDIALCILNSDNLELSFAGAHNPCWIFKSIENEQLTIDIEKLSIINYQLSILEADHQPVGVYLKEKPFTEHKFQLQKEDVLYLFSDGFHSQFGRENTEKYKINRFKELLSNICQFSLKEQKILLEKELINWKGITEQTDDILIVGVMI